MYLKHIYQSYAEILFFVIGSQAEKESYMKKLENESKLVSQLRQQLNIAATKEKEICDLEQQISDLQVFCLFFACSCSY